MKSDEQSNQAIPKGDLCERKLDPTERIYSHNRHLCLVRFQHIKTCLKLWQKVLSGSLSETLRESLKHWSAQILIRGAAYAY